ncbi:nucleoside-diphosphate kinase [Clostridiaceae bacterium UIB06]|uniref:Nucleoside diphosphate kinase n=1 Tax=Clostridium thailandense TaxID=2794346 RepID=A0A949WUY7_9CLOT|nr:nucleoside-diphosphate kinase [Clostridium thailandense]MBV7273097.1 nucleoside-diphosphate kinase [Clostridium thailandense]MCH5135761.1 nucleoside-diphosphate kinase [Clostridiaceae bacterium UIB06]
MFERTLVLIKPDGVQRKLMGKIISCYEDKGLTISAMKMLYATNDILQQHYIEHKNKTFFNELISYLLEGKIVAMIVEGNNAINVVRKINGATDPLNADMGSIRGRFGNDKTKNLVHSSDSIDTAQRELTLWFPEF